MLDHTEVKYRIAAPLPYAGIAPDQVRRVRRSLPSSQPVWAPLVIGSLGFHSISPYNEPAGLSIRLMVGRDAARIGRSGQGVRFVLDATGTFTDREGASKHLAGEADSVVKTAGRFRRCNRHIWQQCKKLTTSSAKIVYCNRCKSATMKKVQARPRKKSTNSATESEIYPNKPSAFGRLRPFDVRAVKCWTIARHGGACYIGVNTSNDSLR